MRFLDVRCNGTRKTGPQRGIACEYLLCRRHPDLSGSIETKCPRCNEVTIWNYSGALLAVSS